MDIIIYDFIYYLNKKIIKKKIFFKFQVKYYLQKLYENVEIFRLFNNLLIKLKNFNYIKLK